MNKHTMAALCAAAMMARPAGAQNGIRGFAPERVQAQRELEAKAHALPDARRARTYLETMAAEPHHAGSAGSKKVAEYALGLFRDWGYEAQIERFEALLPYPKSRQLEMIAPTPFRARLSEPAMEGDGDSRDQDQLPLYNAYSGAGDVTAPLVYVNYGIPEDYAELKKLGVDARGKIVIARYGKSWRGTKAKTAQENGALGCIIYSDPRDDGYFQGDVYPQGPWRAAESAQRGSVMDMPLHVGDPLSPGWASEAGSRRLAREEAKTLMRIPVLPVSWADAKPLLEKLGGPVAPEAWRGALPLTYHVGAGPAVVRLAVETDWETRPVYNVIAKMPGASLPDEWVLYGNHHDAWVNGAADPVSGAVALLETARAAAELHRGGWRPRRTLVFALWDAEEFGLIGSTEWVEKHREELRRKAVVYLNSDMNVGGRLSAGGSPSLETFYAEAVRDAGLPEGSKPEPVSLGALGAGSDYVAFVHHAGIASLNAGFSKAGGNGTYHSIYDSVQWFRKHMDEELTFAPALARLMLTAMLRMSEAGALPFEFTAVERRAREWTQGLEKLDLKPVRERLDRLAAAAKRYEAALAQRPEGAEGLNAELRGLERSLTREQGLPGRPWYKHQLMAPGFYTGYSAKTLPGPREELEAGREAAARQAMAALLESLDAAIQTAERAAAKLGASAANASEPSRTPRPFAQSRD